MQWKLKPTISSAGPLRLTTASQKKFQVPILLILSSFFAAYLCFRLVPNVFETWNAQAVDQLFVLRSSVEKFQPFYDNRVVHVDLNNTSIQRLKNLYLGRGHYAQLIDNLASMHVAAQVFDFVFAAKKDPEGDRALVRAAKKAGNVYFGLAFELWPPGESRHKLKGYSEETNYLDQTKWMVSVEGDAAGLYGGENPQITYPELASSSKGLGSLSVKFDRDGVLRRIPLLVRYKEAYYPLLPLRVVCDYLKVPPEKILLRPGKQIILRDAKKPGTEETHDIRIPIDQKGNMIINYIGPWERMDHYNFADILLASRDRDELEMWKEELQGKIVVVSDISTGSTDLGPVPTDAEFPLSGAHAAIIHSILTESFLRELSGREMLLVEGLLMVVILMSAFGFSSLYFSLGTVMATTAFIAAAGAAFLYGHVIVHLGRPLLMVFFAMVSILIYRYINEEKEKMEGLRQRDFIRDTFGRYLSGEVVEELLGSPEGLKMSGEIREVTFLVSDLRGFTALTSRLSPNEVIEVINRYFEHMVEVIARYRGVVNEFLGDGILVFFGAPLQAEDDAERAVACAIEMQNALVKVNEEQRNLHLPELAMGIGINTGEVVVGNIGSERRAAYGAVGSAINIAYRIESYTVGGQILISPGTHDKIGSNMYIRTTQKVQFKGIDHPVTLYDVAGLQGKHAAKLPEKKAEIFTRLDPPLPFDCFHLDGKTVSETAIPGQVIRLAESVAEVTLAQAVDAHANLRMFLAPQETSGRLEVYAKVLPPEDSACPSSQETLRLQFTWLPEEVKEFLEKRFLKRESS
jgi:class 3 adenylate cyclase/CHASE2 domain-containing sensor protein